MKVMKRSSTLGTGCPAITMIEEWSLRHMPSNDGYLAWRGNYRASGWPSVEVGDAINFLDCENIAEFRRESRVDQIHTSLDGNAVVHVVRFSGRRFVGLNCRFWMTIVNRVLAWLCNRHRVDHGA